MQRVHHRTFNISSRVVNINMEEGLFELENKDHKEFRRNILKTAGLGCETVRFELESWKHKKKQIPGSTRDQTIGLFDEKVLEIEEKLKLQRKTQAGQGKTTQNLDTKAALQSSSLNQEILIKQYQLLVEKHSIEINGLNDKITELGNELVKAKDEKNKAHEEKVFQLSERLKEIAEELRKKEQKSMEKEAENWNLKLQIQDRDRIIASLEKRIAGLEESMIYYKERDFDYNKSVQFLEKEKKRRKIAEAEYKSLLEEVKEINGKVCDQIREEYQEEIRKYQEVIRKFEVNLGVNEDEIMIEKDQKIQKIVELTRNIEYLENQCRGLNSELSKWKLKTTELVEKFFPNLLIIREQLNKLKQNTLEKYSKIKKFYEKNLNELTKKFKETLQASEDSLNYFKTKAESLESRKSSKVKTCKPNKANS